MSPTAPTYGSADHLLRSLREQAASPRMRALALYARDHAGTPHLAGILRQLEADGHGRLAVHMATAARDTAAVARHLAGPDHALRRAALRAVREFPLPDEAVPPVLTDAPTGLRRALYRTLFHARRTSVADLLLPRVRADHGDAEAAALLPACSPGQVARHLPDLRHAVRSWTRLARRHPDILLELLSGVRDDLREHGGHLHSVFPDWRRLCRALDPVRPAELGGLAKDLGPRVALRSGAFPHTLRALPADPGRRRYPQRFPALPDGSRDVRVLHREMRRRPPVALAVLRSMPPAVRGEYLDAFTDTAHDRGGFALLPFLGLLPRDRAEAEARVLLERLAAFQARRPGHSDPHGDLDAIAHLPYGEAVAPLEEAASAGDADRRARGLTRLVEATARTGDPVLLAQVLTERVDRSRSERDPVRRALLAALAAVPPGLLVGDEPHGRAAPDGEADGSGVRTATSLPALRGLLADTLRTRDTSPPTRRALRDLAARLLRHPDTRGVQEAVGWALDAYAGLVARFGADGLGEPGRPRSGPPWWAGGARADRVPRAPEPFLDQVMPRGSEQDLYRRLAPVLRAARARGDFAPAVALARELGRRARSLPGLGDQLVAAIRHDPSGATAAEAADLYLAGPDLRAGALALFRSDHATALVPRVWDVLSRHHAPGVVHAALGAAEARRAAAADTGDRDAPGPDTDPGTADAASAPAGPAHRTRAHTPHGTALPLPGGGAGPGARTPAWVPRIDARTARDWPGDLRDRVAAYLEGLVGDPSLALDEREAALSGLGRLPGTTDRVARFLDGPDIVLREAAARALGHGDRPEHALRLVLAHADGPQSRAAAPAMSRCALAVAPSRLGPVLGRALEGPAKVTVRKAAARLLAHHRPPGAVDILARALGAEGLHRDVRAAVAGSLMRVLDHPAALPALTAHARGFTEVEVQFSLLQVPPMHCPPATREAVAAVVAALPDPGRDHWRLGGWAGRWAPWTEYDIDDAVEALCATDRPLGQAFRVFHALLGMGRGRDRIAEALSRLLASVPGPGEGVPVRRPDGGSGDGPHKRVLRLVDLLCDEAVRVPTGDDPVLRRQVFSALDLLAARDEYGPEAVRLVRAVIAREVSRADGDPDPGALGGLLLRAAGILSRHALLPEGDAEDVVDTVAPRFGRDPLPRETLASVVQHVFGAAARTAGPAGEAMGLIGLGIVGRAGRADGWTAPWPGLLSRAGELGHEPVRLAAWRLAVE
ncbi:HEAT repeat domain-containing protein [Nocardiopsis tropica]|uniref:HEAT repeat domain-containing protein n=1 Tax=Nocardiopsis tropica TaxID=109330 RepID=UPI0031DB98FD